MIMEVELSHISKYRAEFMGMATLGILICHAPGNHVAIPFPLREIMCLGMMGNGIFFIMSGFGLYYSYTKMISGGGNLFEWYKKRFVRILVPYLLFCIVQMIVLTYKGGFTDWSAYLISASLIGYYIDNSSPWFLSVLLPLYVFTPILIRLIAYKGQVLKNSLFIVVVFTLLSFLNTSIFVINAILNAFSCAVPFVFGIALGYCAKKNKKMRIWPFISAGLFYCLAFFVQRNFGFFYLGCFLCIFPFLIIALERCSHDLKVLRWFGSISLESYLTNNYILVGLLPWAAMPAFLSYGNYLPYSLVVIVGIMWAWAIHTMSSKIIKYII